LLESQPGIYENDKYEDDEETGDRMGLVRKVYGILTVQLLITCLFTGFCMYKREDPIFNQYMSSWWIMIPVMITYIASICALICGGQHRNVPTNYILLLIFTLCVSYIVGSVCIRVKQPKTVVEAACLTLGVVVGISLYAIFTK